MGSVTSLSDDTFTGTFISRGPTRLRSLLSHSCPGYPNARSRQFCPHCCALHLLMQLCNQRPSLCVLSPKTCTHDSCQRGSKTWSRFSPARPCRAGESPRHLPGRLPQPVNWAVQGGVHGRRLGMLEEFKRC